MSKLRAAALAAMLAPAGFSAQAADFSFTGTFDDDDDVQFFEFAVGATSLVTLKTYSYAGGTMADGTVIVAGGFDPILALFNDATGALIDTNDDGSAPDVGVDPVTGQEYDTFLQATLDPGVYLVAVSQYDNFALGPNLSDGFTYSGAPFFTAAISSCAAGQFCDFDGDSRTNAWAFDVLNVESAIVTENVPLPAAAPLLLAGLAGVAALRRRA